MYFGKRDVPSLKLVTTLKDHQPYYQIVNRKTLDKKYKIQVNMKQLHQQLTTAIHNNDYLLQEKISVLRIKSRKEIVEILDKKSIG